MAHYTPVCEITELADSEEESQFLSQSLFSIPQYEFPDSPLELHENNYNMESKFDKMNLKTAKEVIKIRKSVQDAGAQAFQNMFHRRNHANRQWQEMETSGRLERQNSYLGTIQAVSEMEESTEQELKAQEEALNNFKIQKEQQKLYTATEFKKRENALQNQPQEFISGLESKGIEQMQKVELKLKTEEEKAKTGIKQIQQSETAKRDQIRIINLEKLKQMKKDMEEKLEAERQKQLQILKPKPDEDSEEDSRL